MLEQPAAPSIKANCGERRCVEKQHGWVGPGVSDIKAPFHSSGIATAHLTMSREAGIEGVLVRLDESNLGQ